MQWRRGSVFVEMLNECGEVNVSVKCIFLKGQKQKFEPVYEVILII